MCLIGESESGHGGRFEPCSEYKRLEKENAELRASIEKQACAMRNYQSAEAKIASVTMENARRLVAECDPANVESEKRMNAILTEENEQLRQDRDRLAGIVEKTPQWIEHDGSFSTLPGEDERILIHRYQSSGHLFCDASKPCWWVDAMKDFVPLRPGDRWMPWPGGE